MQSHDDTGMCGSICQLWRAFLATLQGDAIAAPSAAPAASSAAASKGAEREALPGPSPNSGGLATAGSGGAAAAAASGVDEGWAGDDGLDDIMDDLSSGAASHDVQELQQTGICHFF